MWKQRLSTAVLTLVCLAGAAQAHFIWIEHDGDGTEVKVFGPPKWEKSWCTDDQGRVTLQTPWAGRYVVELVHVEEKPGESAGGVI